MTSLRLFTQYHFKALFTSFLLCITDVTGKVSSHILPDLHFLPKAKFLPFPLTSTRLVFFSKPNPSLPITVTRQLQHAPCNANKDSSAHVTALPNKNFPPTGLSPNHAWMSPQKTSEMLATKQSDPVSSSPIDASTPSAKRGLQKISVMQPWRCHA